MANNTEVVFENIEQRIIKEISDAHYAIFVSVAWFTNKKLFNALLEKAKQNCYVSIIIQLDEINSQCGIDYSQIQIGRSDCFMISKDAELLHDKFCVIDFKKVITGSYNWTYKASQNSENILVVNDPSIASQYIIRFEQQKVKFNDCDVRQQNNSITIDNTHVSMSQQNRVVQVPIPTIKQCPYCEKKIGYNDGFCQHCGEQQPNFQYMGTPCYTLRKEVVCKKCAHKLEFEFIDAMNTKFCTHCGSDNLEWKCTRLFLNK